MTGCSHVTENRDYAPITMSILFFSDWHCISSSKRQNRSVLCLSLVEWWSPTSSGLLMSVYSVTFPIRNALNPLVMIFVSIQSCDRFRLISCFLESLLGGSENGASIKECARCNATLGKF